MSSTANVTRALNAARKMLSKPVGRMSEQRRALSDLRTGALARTAVDAWSCGRMAEHDAVDAAVKAEMAWLDECIAVKGSAGRTNTDPTTRAYLAELAIAGTF